MARFKRGSERHQGSIFQGASSLVKKYLRRVRTLSGQDVDAVHLSTAQDLFATSTGNACALTILGANVQGLKRHGREVHVEKKDKESQEMMVHYLRMLVHTLIVPIDHL